MLISLIDFKKTNGYAVNDSEIGFDYNSIFEVIDWYCSNNIPIMGGDVYIIKDGILEPTYNNWYFNKDDEKTDYVRESILHAKEYINSLQNCRDFIYVLVPN